MTDPIRPLEIRTKRGERHCFHHRKFVDTNARKVECQDCHAVLDAFQALVDWVHARERLIYEDRMLKNLINEQRAELEELKRQARNLKAQIRRAKTKTTPPEMPPDNVRPLYWKGEAK